MSKLRSDFHIYIIIYITKNSNIFLSFIFFNSFVLPTRHHTPTDNDEDKIVPNTNNFMIFAILHFYSFILVIDTVVQNNDNEISLHFNPMRLIFMNYSV
jgi:hypothetical protein